MDIARMGSRATFRERLAGGGLVGTWMMIPHAHLVEILGVAGFDFVIVDLEHSAFGFDAVPPLLTAAEAAGIPAVVRVEANGSRHIAKALDFGADGVMIPSVETREDARQAVRDSKFHPVGARGACPRVRAAGYGATPSAEYYASDNDRRATILLIESPAGMRNLPEILSVEGIDAVFFGFTDLSHAMGYANQPNHPKVLEVIQSAISQVQAKGLAAGLSCYDEAEAARRLAAGLDFVTIAGAEKLFLQACRQTLEKIGRRATR